MLIAPVPYRSHWSDDFQAIAMNLEKAFGDVAMRIDHIGSTSVVGLAAKPVIDIQVTVSLLSVVPAVVERLADSGYSYRSDIKEDRPPTWEQRSPVQWRKAYFKSIDGANPLAHVHVREVSRRNQRYALLFRDFLRANVRARDAYGEFKLKLAETVGHLSRPGGAGPYLDLKDPMFDLIADSAEKWASKTNWCIDQGAVV